jgi:hypothetical protein
MPSWVSRALILLLVMFVVVTAWVLSKDPITTLAIELKTEVASIIVADPNASAFRLPHAVLEGEVACRHRVEVFPERGSKLTYSRFQRGELRIEIDGLSSIEFATSPTKSAPRKRASLGTSAEMTVNKGKCGGAELTGVRLPFQGIPKFGETQRRIGPTSDPEATLLLSGELSVYARAVPLSLSAGPFRRDALYLAHQMSIPAGSVIQSARNTDGPQARWVGFADVSFRDDDPGALEVFAATNTARMQIHMPVPNVISDKPSEPEEIALSLMARLAGDPNLQVVYGVLLAFTVLISTYAAYVGLHPTPEAIHDAIKKDSSSELAGVHRGEPGLRRDTGRRRVRVPCRRE